MSLSLSDIWNSTVEGVAKQASQAVQSAAGKAFGLSTPIPTPDVTAQAATPDTSYLEPKESNTGVILIGVGTIGILAWLILRR